MIQPDPRDPNLDPTIQHPISIASGAAEEPSAPRPEESTLPFRSLFRPPTALVCVVHDDGKGGELHTVRNECFRFGRTEGDVIIPHDTQISGLHCELVRRFEEGVWRWYLRDLDSRNGTFLKLASARLSHDMHLLLGCYRYRFEAGGSGLAPGTSPQSSARQISTSGWQLPKPEDLEKLQPALVRLTPQGDGERFTIHEEDQIVGSDSSTQSAYTESEDLGSFSDIALSHDGAILAIAGWGGVQVYNVK